MTLNSLRSEPTHGRKATPTRIRHATALKNDVALQSLRGPCRVPSPSDDAIDLEKISHEKWLAAAETALANNEKTFAVLGINDILDPTGLVTKLQAKGYKVEVSSAFLCSGRRCSFE